MDKGGGDAVGLSGVRRGKRNNQNGEGGRGDGKGPAHSPVVKNDDDKVSNRSGSEPSTGATSGGGVLAPTHPLLITEILEVVFKHIVAQPRLSDAAKDVRSVRLVSKTWRDVVTPLYRRNRPPTYIGTLLFIDPLKHFNVIRRHADLEKFLRIMKDSTMIPVENFVITYNLYAHKCQVRVKTLLTICGPEVASLSFDAEHDGVVVSDPEGSTNPWTSLSGLGLPKLKRLKFVCFKGSMRNGVNSTQMTLVKDFLQVLLSAAKNLNEFKIDASFTPQLKSRGEHALLQKFENIVIAGLPTTLKILKIHLFMGQSGKTFQKLAETGIKLKTFKFSRCSAVDKGAFCKFLEKQSDTMTELAISHSYDAPSISTSWAFPRMEKIAKLDIIDIIPEPLSFAETFPNITVLNLTYWEKKRVFLDLLSSVERIKTKAPAVKKLHMPYAFDVAPHVNRISQCFPKITQLQLDSTCDIKETLAEVFTYLTDVEQLEIMFPGGREYSADAMLSGVAKADCKRIRVDGNFEGVANFQQMQRKPSILNLTKLETLVLKKENPIDRIILSDFAAHFLLLRMTGLKELSIYRSQLSSEYEERLKGQVTLSITEDGEQDRDDDSDEFNYDSSDSQEEEDDDDDSDDDDDEDDDGNGNNWENME